jgi:undecaprenyl-diphosphatase
LGRAKRFLADRLDPQSHLGLGLTLRLLLFLGAVWAFSGLLDAVLDNDTLVRIDVVVEAWFHAHSSKIGIAIFTVVTQLGSPVFADVLIVLVGIYLWRVRDWLLLWTWLAAAAGGKAVDLLLKNTVHRSRPQYAAAYLAGDSYSFPSGHAMNATICYLFLAYVIVMRSNGSSRVRSVAFLVAAVLIVVVAVSRVYLGKHYPSDVIGGIAAGLAWLSLCGVTHSIVTHARIPKA